MTTIVDGGAIPAGAIIPFGGPIANIPDGFLACNGALINRNDFADLFAAIGTQWGTTSGTNFRVPTTNGNHLRGRANGSGSDPDRNSRTAVQTGGATGDAVGSLQTWRYQTHRHSSLLAVTATSGGYNSSVEGAHGNLTPVTVNRIYNSGNDVNTGLVGGSGIRGANGNSTANDSSPNSSFEASSQRYYLNTNNSGSNQTTGRNVYVEYIIKF